VKTTIEVGRAYDLLAGAGGHALLAAHPREQRLALYGARGLAPGEVERLETIVDEVRARGVAVSNQQQVAGVVAIAAPVTDPVGVVGAISLLGPVERMQSQLDAMVDAVRDAARSVSRLHGAAA
jgi:DNA-binding IclR family transcriptional regulator